MAFDLVVGRSPFIKDSPVIIGQVEFEDLLTIGKLYKKTSLPFFGQLLNYYEDCSFSSTSLIEIKAKLFSYIASNKLDKFELRLIYLFITAVSYAIDNNLSLFGVAD